MKNGNNKGLIVIIVLVILIIFGVTSVFVMNKINDKPDLNEANNNVDKEPEENNDDSSVSQYTGKFEGTEDSYILDINGYESNDTVYYKISDKLTIKLLFDFLGDDRYFDIYINDKHLLKDLNNFIDDKIIFRKLGNDLIYLNSDITGLRSGSVYIINKNFEIVEIFEMDEIAGMAPSVVNINSDNIVVKGSRIGHGPSIIYGDIYKYISKDTVLSDIGLTGDEIVQATYTYNLNNGSLDLNPIISEKMTLSEFIKSLK